MIDLSEETRSFYQQRLTLMYRVGFWLCCAFLGGVVVVRGLLGEGLQSELASPSRWFHVAATVVAGAVYFSLKTRRLPFGLLRWVDAVGVLSLSLLLNLNAGLFHIRTVAVFNLVLTTGLAAVLRAIVIPSTARRTLALGLAASAVTLTVFFLSAHHPAWPVKHIAPDDWPLDYQLVSLTLWLGTLIATASVASEVIYRLHSEVRTARRLGQYVLREKLGEGGMGIVYRATHAMLSRETALKLLPPDRVDPEAISRFEREVIETARLQHPNTVAIYDYGRTLDGVFYYAMEYLDGLTLSDLLEREGELPEGRAVYLLAQVCASLEEAHAMGLVHRDIKPGNIMVIGHTAAYDLIKVLDFGLVKRIRAKKHQEPRTKRVVTGTPLYMSPEAVNNPDAVGPKSDLYAVAAVGYFLLTGQHVFDRPTLAEICAAHLNEKPLPIKQRVGREINPRLEALLMRGLAKAPEDRPATAAEFRMALLECNTAAWTPEQARAWWKTRGERLKNPRGPDLAHPPTVSVFREPITDASKARRRQDTPLERVS